MVGQVLAPLLPLFDGQLEQRRADTIPHMSRDCFNVSASISVLRKWDPTAMQFLITCIDRGAEELDLSSGVVDVVLARHIVAGRCQQIGDRLADRSPTTVTDM